jgi:hypothetical protein
VPPTVVAGEVWRFQPGEPTTVSYDGCSQQLYGTEVCFLKFFNVDFFIYFH